MSKADDEQKLQMALSFHQAGRLDKAADLYRQVIKRDARNCQALHYLGLIEATLGDYGKARALLHRSISGTPLNIQFVENYATVLFQSDDYKAALEICEEGLRRAQTNISLLYVSAISLLKLKRLEESVAQFDKVLSLAPNHVAALNERGYALAEMKNNEAALASFEKALIHQPHYAEAHLNKGNVLGKLWKSHEALAAYDKALATKPDLVQAWIGRGNVLVELQHYAEASLAYDKALSLKPDLAGAWLGRGNVLLGLRRFDEALGAYDKALALDPDLADAWFGRGVVVAGLRRREEALAAYDRAIAINPDLKNAHGARLFAKLYLCDWANLQAETESLLSMIRDQKPASAPFYILAVPSSPNDQLQCTRRFVEELRAFSPAWQGEIYSHDRIRIAYLSADLREHPVGFLTAGLFEHHDKSRFETTVLSTGPDQVSPTRERINAAVDRFIDVGSYGDRDIADLIRRLEIDIVIDLMGFTESNRIATFARRPAPIQVNYLGYSATLGADYIDYIVADATVIPEDQCEFYSERVIWLPDSFLVNDRRRAISAHAPSRRDCGLPEDAFVFCCFNNSYKLAPEMFGVWMRLLKGAPDSVLWLSEANATVHGNLRREAESHGVAAGRLIFAPRMPEVADHLARQRHADLFLDTLPYNAHTTACDALWAGVPLVTCLGAAFVGRVAASLLKAVGVDELITMSLQEYEALALKLVHDRAALAAVREKLARNRDTLPLFDTARTTRQLEAAYTIMWERYRRGETAKPLGETKPLCVTD
jgi:protein O-GlcNAc transferase